MVVLYVTSDEEGAGKTSLCTTLAHELKSQGGRAAVVKPLPAAAGSGEDPDPGIYHRLLGQPETSLPFRLSNGCLTEELVDDIKESCERLLEGQDLVLVEGTSDLSGEDAMRLVEALEAKVLVMTRYQAGLCAPNLAGWRRVFNDRVLGFVINGLTLYRSSDARARLLPSMKSEGLVSLGVIPEDRRLLGITVSQLASSLGGRFIVGEGFADRLVEHFMIGGMGLDSGELYFGLRDNKAVIVRGDRPDIQMAALQTPTSCLVLTQGIEPIEYVRYEAEEEEVPIIVVETDTLSTMASLNTVQERVGFDHPAKLQRFAELVRAHVDVATIWKELGLGS